MTRLGGFANLASSVAARVNALSNQLAGWLEPKRAPVVPDPNLLASKAKESSKISLHLLARSGRWEELIQLAETADDRELAVCAVNEIGEQNPEKAVDLLVHLARGTSHAVLPAIVALINEGHRVAGQEIYLQRLANDELFALIRNGRAKPYSVVELLGVVAEQFEESAMVGYFLHVWQSLASNHIDQVKLLLEILGDPDPMGVRYVPESNIIPRAIKLKAIELLISAGGRDYERGLCCATSDPDDAVAYQATLALMQFWQSPQGMIPQGLEPFTLLDTGLLYQLCQISSSFNWRDGTVTSEICEQLAEVLTEMGSVDPQSEQAHHHILESRRAAYVKQLDELSEQRVRSLQPLLNAITTALNLPYVTAVAKDIEAEASYSVGIGMITLSRQVLLQDRPLTESFMSTLIHELAHMEQDYLMICSIADDLDLKLGQHGKLLIALWTKYSDVVGYAPDHVFLLGVLRMRNDQRLTEAERVRAERLLVSHTQTTGNNKRCQAIDARIAYLSDCFDALEVDTYNAYLLTCLEEEQSLQALYQNGRVPEALVEEIRTCRADLEQVIGSLYPNDAPTSTSELISLAQALLNTPFESHVTPIVDRLKTVLKRVLTQEYRNLHKRKLELMRQGYFEEEAYAITDRVDVIVKALRKGWFSPQAC